MALFPEKTALFGLKIDPEIVVFGGFRGRFLTLVLGAFSAWFWVDGGFGAPIFDPFFGSFWAIFGPKSRGRGNHLRRGRGLQTPLNQVKIDPNQGKFSRFRGSGGPHFWGPKEILGSWRTPKSTFRFPRTLPGPIFEGT